MAFLGWWSPSWTCGGQDHGGLTLASPCVQRGLIDCVNAVLLVAYVSALLAACVRGRGRSGAGARRRWGVAAVTVCCVAVAASYAVAALGVTADASATTASAVRGLVWVAVAASLHFQPTRPARAGAVLWWTIFSLLITAYNAEVLTMGDGIDVAEAVAWAVNFLLLLCALGSLLRRSHGHQDDNDDDGLSEPLIDKPVHEDSELYRASVFSQLAF